MTTPTPRGQEAPTHPDLLRATNNLLLLKNVAGISAKEIVDFVAPYFEKRATSAARLAATDKEAGV